MHLPAYGRGSLAEVLPSAAAALGIPGFTDTLGIAATTGPLRRACVLLVDGLGWQQLTAHSDVAPTMNAMVKRSITTAFPATTATSITTVGTGVPPGLHGVVGYKVAIPGKGRIMNSLRWDDDVDPLVWQPHEPVLARAAGTGLAVHHVGPKFHDGGGLTRASTRGARFRPAYGLGDLAATAAAVTASADWALTYAYFGDLDTVGHLRGTRSDAWRAELAHVDLMVGALRDLLPRDAALIVIADHGMIEVPADQRVDCDTTAELRESVVLLGGEGRARHLYTRPGAADAVRDAWAGVLGDRATAVTREQAIADGWFGPQVADAVRERIGDVVVAAGPELALIASEREPLESSLVALHGGMEPAEQLIPLLISAGT